MLKRLATVFSPARSVQGRFSAALTISGIAFGLLLAALMEVRLESQATKAAKDTLDLTAHRIAARLATDLENRALEIQLIGEFLQSTGTLKPTFVTQQLDRLQNLNPSYAWIGFTSPKGKVLAASDNLLVGADVSERAWFQSGLQRLFVGDPRNAVALATILPPTLTGEPIRFVDIAFPLRHQNGDLLGVIGAHLLWDWANTVTQDALNDLDSAVTAEVFIADSRGTWLLKPAAESSSNKEQLMQRSPAGSYIYADASVRSAIDEDGLGWRVMVREKSEIAYAPIYESRFFLAWFLTLSSILFMVVGWFFAGRIVQPIVTLRDTAAARRSGQSKAYHSAPSSSADETGILDRIIHDMAFTDGLTGLANRRQLNDQLEALLAIPPSKRPQSALLLVDLDKFRYLNDTRGHAAGDEMLVMLAKRLAARVHPPNLLARLSSDEFGIIFQKDAQDGGLLDARARAFAYEMLAAISQPFLLKTGQYHASASIGICLLHHESLGGAQALQHAELAMFEAKHADHEKVQVFDQTIKFQLDEQVALEDALRTAIPNELRLLYQPQVDQQGQIVGFEALVRWEHPIRKQISPAQFIPIAEKSGLILSIGHWVMRQACLQLKEWSKSPATSGYAISVNVSAREFTQPDYADQVLSIIKSTGANPNRLKLELTESILANDVDLLIERMVQLKSSGIGFSLDDFGTGFSSLAYLKRMPLDLIKIDQSFVSNLTTNPNDAAIVRTVIALGTSLGIQVVAEGVETQAQIDFLSLHGCHYFQGYFVGKPITAQALRDIAPGA
jgi:diguanylate cyclase (GGDEF)-like protein